MSSSPAFLNGEYQPLNECKVSVLDRGFIFGDGIYELLPIYANKPFYLEQHLQRLVRSMEEIRIENPYTTEEWKAIIQNLIDRAEPDDLAVYIQVTRGMAPRDHVFPPGSKATVFAMANPLPLVSQEQLDNGVELITSEDIRWQRCDIKVISLLANILAKQDAVLASAVEAIMVRDGCALEGAASNLFVVRDGTVYTHPKDHLILPGITRDFIIELLNELNVECKQQSIPKDWLYSADEVWITSSTKEVLAATNIDQQIIANGKPGELWQKTYDLYQQKKA
ncbi:MAG: D-amino acid aminotransferase [Pseudomonadota bacterium]